MKNALSKVSLSQWFGLIIGILAIIFVFTNTNTARITFYGLHLSGPTWLILLIVLVVGWIVGVLTARKRYLRR